MSARCPHRLPRAYGHAPNHAQPCPLRACARARIYVRAGGGPIWLVHMRRRSAYGPAGSARHARTQVHGPAPPPVLVAAKARLRFARRPTSQPSQRVPLVARCCNVGASAPLPYPGQSAAPECRTPAAPGQRSCPERPVRRSPCSPSRAVPWHHPADRRWPAAKAKPHRGPAPKPPPPLLGRCGLTLRRRQSQSRGAWAPRGSGAARPAAAAHVERLAARPGAAHPRRAARERVASSRCSAASAVAEPAQAPAGPFRRLGAAITAR